MESPRRQTVLEAPSLETAEKAIKSGISQRRTVVIAGKCTVEYEGRASSSLGAGDRLVVFKPDGSALVHRPMDYSPVNWQPSGSIFSTRLQEKSLVIRVFRRKEHESMLVSFTDIYLVSVLNLIDKADFNLYASEKEMQEALYYKPDLLEPGFRPISREMAVDPGFIDLIGYDAEGNLAVVEIKRVKANKKAVEQLRKYMEVIDLDEKRTVRGILVAPEITRDALKLLNEMGYEFKPLSPRTCSEVLRGKKRKPLTAFFEP